MDARTIRPSDEASAIRVAISAAFGRGHRIFRQGERSPVARMSEMARRDAARAMRVEAAEPYVSGDPTMRLHAFLPTIIAMTASSGPLFAGVGDDAVKLHDPTPVADAAFGASIAAHAGRVVVGRTGGGGVPGAASVFESAGGRFVHTFHAPSGSEGAAFGASVAIAGSVVAVGAPGDDELGPDAGAVHLFDLSTGRAIRKLLASNGAAGDGFGSALAIDGGILAVGARYRDGAAPNAGAVYLFDLVSGVEHSMLEPAGLAANDSFGCALAMDGGTLVVGAQGTRSGPLFFAGAAYVVGVEDGLVRHVLRASDPGVSNFFGAAVAIDDGLIVVGAWAQSIVGDHSGAAYVFDATTGLQLGTRITPPDAADRDHFGRAVSIGGGRIAIGAPGDDDFGFEAGSISIYDAQSLERIAELHATDARPLARVGSAVALADSIVCAGAPGDAENAAGAGAAYLFGATGPGCPADVDADGVVGGTDLAIVLSAWGQDSASGADLDASGAVDAADLAFLLAAWGPCR